MAILYRVDGQEERHLPKKGSCFTTREFNAICEKFDIRTSFQALILRPNFLGCIYGQRDWDSELLVNIKLEPNIKAAEFYRTADNEIAKYCNHLDQTIIAGKGNQLLVPYEEFEEKRRLKELRHLYDMRDIFKTHWLIERGEHPNIKSVKVTTISLGSLSDFVKARK